MRTLYKNATLIDAKESQNFLVEDGRFVAFGPHLEAVRERVDVLRSVREGRTLFEREPARVTSHYACLDGGPRAES